MFPAIPNARSTLPNRHYLSDTKNSLRNHLTTERVSIGRYSLGLTPVPPLVLPDTKNLRCGASGSVSDRTPRQELDGHPFPNICVLTSRCLRPVVAALYRKPVVVNKPGGFYHSDGFTSARYTGGTKHQRTGAFSEVWCLPLSTSVMIKYAGNGWIWSV